jgi:hypothetical protein
MANERLIDLARAELTLDVDGCKEPWLWDRTERVARNAMWLARQPAFDGKGCDTEAIEAAALFHLAGWSEQFRAGHVKRWQLLSRPTSDVQRELGASILQEKAGTLLNGRTLRIAADAIRQSNQRNLEGLEARILHDAIGLEETGPMYLVQQLRTYIAEGRTLSQLIKFWERQREYQYWGVRLQDGFYFDIARERARVHLQHTEAFVMQLREAMAGPEADARRSAKT